VYRSAGEASGVAVLEVSLPTGYGADQASLDALIGCAQAPTLTKVKLSQRSVNFFFDQVRFSGNCVLNNIIICYIIYWIIRERYIEISLFTFLLMVLSKCELKGSGGREFFDDSTFSRMHYEIRTINPI
jgi:hypothetical protein